MSQRNHQNARYQEETKPKGVTKKSPSSFKPKSKAASSVIQRDHKPSKQDKEKASKERARLERKAEKEIARENANPQTDRFKQLRMYWYIALGVAVVTLLISWFGRPYLPEHVDIVFMVLSYAAIVIALYIDLGLIRKERKRWEEERTARKSKKERRAEKEARMAAIKAREEEEKQNKSNGGGLFGSSKKKAVEAADNVVAKQQAAKK